jgi:O-methyltransferase
MKKAAKKFLNNILKHQGLKIVRIHDIVFLNTKYSELINEMELAVRELQFSDLPQNKKRTKFLSQLNGTQISEAFYLLVFLHRSLKLKGDICEFGIANGTTSSLFANEIKDTTKKLWLFDSFKGLSKPSAKDVLINDMFRLKSMAKYEGTMSYAQSEVLNRLKMVPFPKKRIMIIPGYIEQTTKQKNLPRAVAFAYIDFDLYEPTKVALEFLDTVLTKKGHIVIDDYNYFSEGVKIAVKEFIETRKKKYNYILPKKFAGHFCILQKL